MEGRWAGCREGGEEVGRVKGGWWGGGQGGGRVEGGW